MDKIIAVIITHDESRYKYLSESIRIFKDCDMILIINNGNESLFEMINNDFKVSQIFLPKNLGCSYGLYYGFGEAINLGADWIIWIDDDMIPSKHFIKNVRFWINDDFSYMSCPVYYSNTNDLHKNNFNGPHIVNAKAVKNVGLPAKNMIISGDDHEFKRRLLNYAPMLRIQNIYFFNFSLI